MDDLIPIQMTTRDRAHWLADKVPQHNDYTAEAIAMLRRLADENARMISALSEIAEWTDRWTTKGHPVSAIARAAMAEKRP